MQIIESDRPAAYLKQIRNCYPDLEIRSNRLAVGGEVNDILIVNDDLIFRFPKLSEGLEQFRVEMTILSSIQWRTFVPVPDPIYHSQDMQTVGTAFFGYKMLPGEALRHHLLAVKKDATRLELGFELASFLADVHNIPVEVLPPGIPMHDSHRREEIPGVFVDIGEKLYPFMRPDARDEVTSQFEEYIGDPTRFAYKRALRHGDLGPGNILVDPKTLDISGIIDFGSAGLDDPAIDLGHISFWGQSLLGMAFVEHVYDMYGMPESLLKRVEFYKVLIACCVALDGQKRKDQESFDFAMKQFV
jgi:aminoglycoside 2''-phosphotransferase